MLCNNLRFYRTANRLLSQKAYAKFYDRKLRAEPCIYVRYCISLVWFLPFAFLSAAKHSAQRLASFTPLYSNFDLNILHTGSNRPFSLHFMQSSGPQ
jgi:hypothetical protein